MFKISRSCVWSKEKLRHYSIKNFKQVQSGQDGGGGGGGLEKKKIVLKIVEF